MAGKTDTRQKMINMMYLVFIAMLALNISKEVLATLGILNDDLESSIVELESSSKINYDQISSNSDNLDYKIAAEMVGNIKNVSDDFYNFIQNIKDSLISSDENNYLKEVSVKSNRDSIIVMTDYQIMDKSQTLDDYFFVGDLYTEKGDLFLNKFTNYPFSINETLDQITDKELSSEKETKINFEFGSIKDDLSNRFKYSEKVVTVEGTESPFLNYHFQGFPMIASISKLTKIQSDIRYIENKVLIQILSAVRNKGLNFNTFQTLLETTKPVYYTTDVIDAAVVMGKKEESFKPDGVDLFINGNPLKLNEYKIESVILLPQMLHSILNAIQPNDPRIQSLKFVALGGAKTPRLLIQKAKDLGLPIYEGYGLSECSSVVSLNLPHAYKDGSVGKPLSNRKIRIAEDHEIEICMTNIAGVRIRPQINLKRGMRFYYKKFYSFENL